MTATDEQRLPPERFPEMTVVPGGTVPSEMASRWQDAYRRYGTAFELTNQQPVRDPRVAQEMSGACTEVARAWQDIAFATGLPWWSVAAINSAVQAFEVQAGEWRHRASELSGKRRGEGRR